MRFYSGFSFKLKWRHLKWLVIPLFAILSYFSGSYGFINVFAVETDNPHWILTMQDYDTQLKSVSCGNNGTMYDVVNDFIDNFDDTYYNLTIGQPWNNGSWIVFYLYSKDYTNDNFYYNALSSGNRISLTYPYSSSNTRRPFFLMKDTICSNYQDNIEYQRFYTLYTTNTYVSSNTTQYFYYNNYDSPSYAGDKYEDLSSTITSLGSFNTSIWYYYSTIDYKYNRTSGPGYYAKPIYITDNDTTYVVGDIIPSYYDLYHNNIDDDISDNNYFIGSKNSLGTIYTNFEPSYINHFDFDISFNTNINFISANDYYNNIDFTNFNCYGRINHNDNYYSYEKFSSCTFEINSDNLISSSDNDLVEFSIQNLEIYNSNNIKITDFSSYDKIFIYLDFQYDDGSLNTYVSNLQFNSSMNMLYLDNLKGEIFDDFDLPSYFKMFITNTGFSNSMSSNISVRTTNSFLSSNNFLYSQPYSTTTLEPTQVYGFISTNFQNLAVNNSQNIGYMIYHQINNLNLNINPHLDFVLMRDIIISFRNISSNDFYYADDTGTITNNNIDIDYSYGVEESFGDITGLLPPGPLDSLLNIPFKYLSKTINSLNETCSPLSIPFVFDSELTFPCFDTYYEEFPSSLKLFTEVVPCAFILIFYFKHLYKKISRATTLETTENDEWGCL